MNQLSAEFALLYFMVNYLEENGITYKLAIFSIDDEMVVEVNKVFDSNFTLSDLLKSTDFCLSHELIDHRTIGGKYRDLGITLKGVGKAISKRKADELKINRSTLKNASDYVEDHKGLFILLGSVIGLIMLGLKVFGK